MAATDIQSLFAARGNEDLLGARKVEGGLGLCLSGGGYRAMLYHAGALLHLNELGLLGRLDEVSSVSGGSITSGVLATRWRSLDFDDRGVATNFRDVVVVPLIAVAEKSIDIRAALMGFLPGSTASGTVAHFYERELFHGATLQDLPERPRFTFMATNLQTGNGWRFARDYAADFRVGRITNPRFTVASVVAASSAFPPFLSPARFDLGDHVVEPMEGADLHRPPFTHTAVLTDGGAYDNLGLERVWKRCRSVLVSNAGACVPEIGSPTGRWFGQAYRTLNIIHGQAENLRRRLLFAMANAGQRKVAYWSIDTSPCSFGLSRDTGVTAQETEQASQIPTRLTSLPQAQIDLLIRAGYAAASAAIERHLSDVVVRDVLQEL
jgi:NTE family protein